LNCKQRNRFRFCFERISKFLPD